MGPTTSALVRPAPPFSRPPPGAALRVMPPKKRVKLEDDNDEELNSTQTVPKKSETLKKEQNKVDLKKVFWWIAFNFLCFD